MAERVPHAVNGKHDHVYPQTESIPFPLETSEPTSRSGTYVVQIPKDQIYRFPPPEHALIAERHHGKPPQTKRPCCSCCCCIFVSIIVISLLVGLFASISVCSIFLKYKSPTFRIEGVLVKNPPNNHKHQQYPDYDISLKAENPYQRVHISYGEGGDASLSFGQQEIAAGKSPTFDQAPKNTTVYNMIFHGSKKELPREMEKSMKSTNQKVHISLSISMGVPIRLKIGALKTGSKNISVACNLTVDTLAKHTRVLSQECHTKTNSK